MPTLFSTLTRCVSTPRVIQASTTSFCFAGRVSSSRPGEDSTRPILAASSAPALQLRSGSPFAFVHQGDDGLLTARGRAGSSLGRPHLRPAARPPRLTELSHEQLFLPATDDRAD